MAVLHLAPVLHYLRQVRGESADARLADARLLEHFVRHGDEAAFATLLQRYGPMVFGLCRRVLRDRHEAEDAFQATFLLLVRKAGSLRQPELLGHWLYGVAYRTALKAKSLAFRRAATACLPPDMAGPASDDLLWRDLRPILDDAINGLPAKYRVPFVLCHLQGLTNAQAARQLGCPEGTVATRLSRARQRLRGRLAKHGLGVAAGALAVGLGSKSAAATLPALLLVSTLRIATVFRVGTTPAQIPARVAVLTEGVCKAMFLAKLRFVLGTVLVVAAALGATGAWTFGALASDPPPNRSAPPPPPAIGPIPLAIDEPAPRAYEAKSATVRTDNFIVEAPSRRIAQLVGDAAERFRKSEAIRWLGKELPAWSEPCPLRVIITEGGQGGATTFAFDGGKVKSRDMHLEGALDRILTGCLPHEVTHTILADHFRAPIPRWADEGAAVMAEDEEERQRYDALLLRIMDVPGRLIPLGQLLPMKDFPKDIMCLYVEGYSLTRFLVERKDRKTFLEFFKHGMTAKSWDESIKKYYGFESISELQEAWLEQVVKEAKSRERPEEEKRVITSGPPTFGRASMDKTGLFLSTPVSYYEPHTKHFKGAGEEVTTVTSYELKVSDQVVRLDRKHFRATDLAGKEIDKNDLEKALQTPTFVLVAYENKKVDPYYLKVVKEGTIIILPDAPPTSNPGERTIGETVPIPPAPPK